ncbi:hypothetical protein ACWDCB_20220 [Streptomyces sp. NPDC001178]
MEWCPYAGLDDKTLDLLKGGRQLPGGGDPRLRQRAAHVPPDELERAEAAFDAARTAAIAGWRWVAGLERYEPVLDALKASPAAYKIGNSVTTLG